MNSEINTSSSHITFENSKAVQYIESYDMIKVEDQIMYGSKAQNSVQKRPTFSSQVQECGFDPHLGFSPSDSSSGLHLKHIIHKRYPSQLSIAQSSNKKVHARGLSTDSSPLFSAPFNRKGSPDNFTKLISQFVLNSKVKATKNENFIIYPNKINKSIQGFSAYTTKNRKPKNEDKLGINLNCKRGKKNEKINFFGVFDGHCGVEISNKLAKELHLEILNNEKFDKNICESILNAFQKLEKKCLEEKKTLSGGSCSLLLIEKDDTFYLANLGDSRGIISSNYAENINSLTIDHKPNEPNERKRIEDNKGTIEICKPTIGDEFYRVSPGGLAVSRTIGDYDAKVCQDGSISEVISSIPDTFVFKTKKETDFILLACDGVFDKLSNVEITIEVYKTLKEEILNEGTFSNFLSNTIINIMKRAMEKRVKDNLSCVFFVFDNLLNLFETKNYSKVQDILANVEKKNKSGDRGEKLYKSYIKKNLYIYQGSKIASNLNSNVTQLRSIADCKNKIENITQPSNHTNNSNPIVRKRSVKKKENICCKFFI